MLFSFCATLHFCLMNALVYVDIDHSLREKKVTRNEKWKKQLCVFVYIKYGKFGSVLPGSFLQA